ncbi:MAG: type II toxin-antitoxin system HicB family antitoxin, partial [Metallibacterium sp.]
LPVRLDTSRGKGSHQTYFGSVFTVVRNPKVELKTGTFHAMCATRRRAQRSLRFIMERFEYAVALTPADEGGFVVTCRDLPQLITQGESVADALAAAADAMDKVFATYMLAKLDFPHPSKQRRDEHRVAPPPEAVAKAALYVAMRESGISNVQLARQLGVNEKEVRRLLDPHYASKLPRIAQAVALLGKRLVIGLDAA